jgi:hypothetical protein
MRNGEGEGEGGADPSTPHHGSMRAGEMGSERQRGW